MIKKTYKIKGMHCSSCPMLIEGELEDIGVKSRANYQKQIVEVEIEDERVTDEDIRQAVKRAGYEVEI
ncbi:hypothetical protein A2154_04330 [Candidatus Gottesmanbacteria bacterium RBG_16_43_7]|uniref:HMA domain-containing protein n=1 Tax=Candidatus Gottesmanbacteria bacterium RBG_16_43_7 TaxID=1798373 RepID=A0A1F5ZD28_9BACT|nr:MAG: hypothetical protein A2154_04330 [Candidatus Gottesmanbacteria bacterium RBG_16_43_7]